MAGARSLKRPRLLCKWQPAAARQGSPAAFALLDTFADQRPAGGLHGTPAVPGPGTRTVSDTEGKLSLAGGRLWCAGPKQVNSYSDPLLRYPPAARQPGLAFQFSLVPANISDLLFHSLGTGASDHTPTIAGGPRWLFNSAGRLHVLEEGYKSSERAPQVANYRDGLTYILTIVCRQEGGHLYFVQGGDLPNPTLVHVTAQGGAASYVPILQARAGAFQAEDVKLLVLGGPFAQQFGLALGRSAAPASGTCLPGAADGLFEFTWTPAANETLELRFRRQDDDNCLLLRASQAAGTLKLLHRSGGSETEQASASQTWTPGSACRLVAAYRGLGCLASVNGVTRIATHNMYFAAALAGGLCASGFAQGAEFVSWPAEVDLGCLGVRRVLEGFFPIGDSKTLGTSDLAYTPQGYPTALADLLNRTSAGRGWVERPPRIGLGGWTWAAMRGVIEHCLAMRPLQPAPRFVLWNLGANDAAAAPSELAFKDDVSHTLDAVHARYPQARHLLMPVWRRDLQGACGTLNAWLAQVAAARAGWCTLAQGEAQVLADHSADGIHPDPAGYLLMAALWKTAMGR